MKNCAKKVELPLPDFYVPDNASRWEYNPNFLRLQRAVGAKHRTAIDSLGGSHKMRIAFLGIDLQKDFCIPPIFMDGEQVGGGTLFAAGRSGRGAVHDCGRIAEFLYRNLCRIHTIFLSGDSHSPYQIFFRWFWTDEFGLNLLPFDEIDADLVLHRAGKKLGRAKVSPKAAQVLSLPHSWLEKQVAFYVRELQKGGEYQLCIWPEHSMDGTDGQSMVGVVEEAALFHSILLNRRIRRVIKGFYPLTENYSIFKSEVLRRWDGPGQIGKKDVRLLKDLLSYDAVVIAGEASSHCYMSSVDDLLDEVQRVDRALAKKIYLLIDCTSSVTVKNPAGGFFVDYTEKAEAAFQRYREFGMYVVRSTDPMWEWPGVIGKKANYL